MHLSRQKLALRTKTGVVGKDWKSGQNWFASKYLFYGKDWECKKNMFLPTKAGLAGKNLPLRQ